MTILTRTVFAIVLSLLPFDRMSGCSCLVTGDPVDAIPSADAVFRGTVLATELFLVGDDGQVFRPQPLLPASGRIYRATVLRVTERFVGAIGPLVIVASGSGGGDCGYGFRAGTSYVVYGSRTKDPVLMRVGGTKDVLTTSVCSFTAPESERTELMDRIRKRYAPSAPVAVE